MDSGSVAIPIYPSKIKEHVASSLLATLILSAILVSSNNEHANHRPPVAKKVHIKVLIPSLVPDHYKYWLKNHHRASENFREVCKKFAASQPITDIAKFQSLHDGLAPEDYKYFYNLDYGLSILSRTCKEIDRLGKSCWGYEHNCHDIYLMPNCTPGGDNDISERTINWFNQADFGYVRNIRKEMGRFCSPDKTADRSGVSSFECTKHFTSCRGQNLFIELNKRDTSLPRGQNYEIRFDKGKIGGWKCDLQEKRILEENGMTGRLQSWFNELSNYSKIENSGPRECDITIYEPVFMLKLDETKNMYDYMGSFVNLYTTMHLNNRFSENNRVLIWDRRVQQSKFDPIWHAFSKYQVQSIEQFRDLKNVRKICFKEFIFSLLSRNGFYRSEEKDNELIPGCEKSGLYDAFSKHILHRLNIPQSYDREFHEQSGDGFIRIAILSRINSPFKNLLNEDELVKALKQRSPKYFVEVVKHTESDFSQTLKIISNTEILVGLHDPALTYTLFLPQWASLVELHDHGSPRYRNLASLRGLTYHKGRGNFVLKVPINNNSVEYERLAKARLLDDDRHSNYMVNVEEFVTLIESVAEEVNLRRAPHFKQADDTPNATTSNQSPTGEVSTEPASTTASSPQDKGETDKDQIHGSQSGHPSSNKKHVEL